MSYTKFPIWNDFITQTSPGYPTDIRRSTLLKNRGLVMRVRKEIEDARLAARKAAKFFVPRETHDKLQEVAYNTDVGFRILDVARSPFPQVWIEAEKWNLGEADRSAVLVREYAEYTQVHVIEDFLEGEDIALGSSTTLCCRDGAMSSRLAERMSDVPQPPRKPDGWNDRVFAMNTYAFDLAEKDTPFSQMKALREDHYVNTRLVDEMTGLSLILFALLENRAVELVDGQGRKGSRTWDHTGDEYRVVNLRPGVTHKALIRAFEATYRKRFHGVRGHYRHYLNEDGSFKKRIFIAAHNRGDKSLGTITHDYHVVDTPLAIDQRAIDLIRTAE